MARDDADRPRVLIVEDEALIRWSLAQTLEAAGVTIVEAADATAGMAVLRAETRGFDVAVLDVRLPDGDGVGLLAAIRWRWPATRVLLMTAFAASEVRELASQLGAIAVVDKPFDLDAMAGLILHAAA
jgi:DNA-binding NtrC family response regulator